MELVLTGCELFWVDRNGCGRLEVSFYQLSTIERLKYEAQGYAEAESIRGSRSYGLI